MPYRVEIASAAARDVKRLPPAAIRSIRETIASLAQDPRPLARTRKVSGRKRSYRIKVGNFRIVYDVFDDQGLVVIARVLGRSETTYRRLT